jgi:Integrase zinc binding domain/Integrase core domain
VLPEHREVRRAALYQVHDAPWAGHVGRERTRLALRTIYWWPGMDHDVRTYVQECDKCQRNKAHHQIKENFLVPLPVPERPWSTIGVDFITQLPVSEGMFDAIAVFTCHFSKMVHLVPCHSNITSEDFAALYRRQCFRLHGVQENIVSDRGTQFVAAFWQQFCKDVGVRLRMSSAYQPSTDGLVERHNKVIEEMLRSYVNSSHRNWCSLLDCAEFAVNSACNGHGNQ